ATYYPLGNCDSLKLETFLSYLTQLETVSNRFSPPGSFFALLTRANVSEELVNSASGSEPCGPVLKRGPANQPGFAFPQLPGIILETFGFNLLTAAIHLSSFNELPTSYRETLIRQ